VIEIVNDDMPFLVDSVMSELAERGLDVRLVAHPSYRSRATKSGKLTAPRQKTPRERRAARELHPYPRRASRTCTGGPRSCRR
jgi:glutamate dehydrogenase